MLNRYIFTIALLITMVSTHAQNKVWGEAGARWKFDVLAWGGPQAYEIWVDADTTIMGKRCQIFRTFHHEFYWTGQYSLYRGKRKLEEHITHISGDTVFFYHHGKFHILYNFAAEVGDTWDLGLDSNAFGGQCSTSVVRVAKTGTQMINGQRLRFLKLEMTHEMHSYDLAGRVYEKMGRKDYPFPLLDDWCAGPFKNLPLVKLRCYEDAYLPTFNTNVNMGDIWLNDCDLNIFMGVGNSDGNENVKVFPNPVNDVLNIEWSQPGNHTVELIDVTGTVVDRRDLNQGDRLEWPTSGITPGIYLIRMTDAYGHQNLVKIVKNQ